MVSTPKPPPAPDPVAITSAQQTANEGAARTQAALNRLNETTPFGNVSYQELGPDQYQRTTTLDPASQQQLDAERALAQQLTGLAGQQFGRASDVMSQPFDLSGLPAAPQANEQTRQAMEQALLGRIEPQFDRDRQGLETQLANQGFARGSEAWNRSMDELNRSRNDARFGATMAGGQEQSRLFGLESSARERALQELVLQRGMPINEIAALLGTAPGIQVPQFGQVPQVGVAAPDAMGAHAMNYQAQQNAYNQRAAGHSSMMGNIFGLGGTALGAFFGGPAGAAVGGSAGRMVGGGYR